MSGAASTAESLTGMHDIGEGAVLQGAVPSNASDSMVSGSRERQGRASVCNHIARVRGLNCESGAEKWGEGAQDHLAKRGLHDFLDFSDLLSAFE